uniref:Uncharacterized protein n=1 Tax=Arundo donax TaxID=35708 RepID=A0A0A8Z4U8_ARUDO
MIQLHITEGTNEFKLFQKNEITRWLCFSFSLMSQLTISCH